MQKDCACWLKLLETTWGLLHLAPACTKLQCFRAFRSAIRMVMTILGTEIPHQSAVELQVNSNIAVGHGKLRVQGAVLNRGRTPKRDRNFGTTQENIDLGTATPSPPPSSSLMQAGKGSWLLGLRLMWSCAATGAPKALRDYNS